MQARGAPGIETGGQVALESLSSVEAYQRAQMVRVPALPATQRGFYNGPLPPQSTTPGGGR